MNTIVVPIDFSPKTDNAGRYAINLAGVMGAQIIFIHAEEKNAMESKHRFKDELFTMTGSNMHANINFVSSDKSLSSAGKYILFIFFGSRYLRN
jgi:nucleotide-binding universal stress UspA family protein